MKSPDNNPLTDNSANHLRNGTRQRKGVALILVVSFVVLLSALVVGFFSRVTTDLASSRSYAEGVGVRQLADSAVGVVMGQIREATTVPNGCWGSQPGMIRVYRKSAGQPGADAHAFYKLYSSNDLIVSGREIQNFDPSKTTSSTANAPEVPLGNGGWRQQPAHFVDLNDPVDVQDPTAPTGTKRTIKRYPIFDPSVAAIYDSQNSRPAKPAWRVEGCEIALPSNERQGNDAPMPVRWIYVLKDGTLTAPPPIGTASGDSGLKADWTAGVDGTKTGIPTKANPIVGRIAFWTDDETCKVNVNTAGGFLLPDGLDEDVGLNYRTPTGKASGDEKNPGYYHGSFWDTPRVQTYFDRGVNNADAEKFRGGLSNAQPGQNEFQRYPGHPSTTSLGLVMRYLLDPKTSKFTSEKLYALTPRLTPGGSRNGTERLEVKIDRPLQIKASYESTVKNAATFGTGAGYHLLASVDELFYTTKNGPGNADGSRKSAVDGVNDWVKATNSSDPTSNESQMPANSITPQLVDQLRFFLTAHSRTPELNLFGRPRVTMWPVHTAKREVTLQSNSIRNAKDDLIRFCSTVGRNPNSTTQATSRQGEFIFDREDPYSSTLDFNLPRNQQVFSYLRELTSSNAGIIPGFGSSFQAKYANGPGGRDQILTEIFDYIRTVNQKDSSRDRLIDDKVAPNTSGSRTDLEDTNSRMKSEARYAAHSLVVPTRATVEGRQVSGFGRYPTITEATLVFYHAGYTCVPKKDSPLAKEDLPKFGSLGTPTRDEVVIYDITNSPGDNDANTGLPTPNALANANLTSEWAKNNVEKWTGQLIRAFVIFETFNPMQGYAPVDSLNDVNFTNTTRIGSNQKYERYAKKDNMKGYFVHELDLPGQFAITTTNVPAAQALDIGRDVTSKPLKNKFTRTSGETWGGRNFGGTEGFFHTIQDDVGRDPTKANYYSFQSLCVNPVKDGVRVSPQDTQFDFLGGDMELSIRYADEANPKHDELIQKVKLTFPDATNWPLPTPYFRPDPGGFDGRRQAGNTDKDDSWNRWSTHLQKTLGLPSGWAMAAFLPSRIGWSRLAGHAPWTKFNREGKQVGDGYNYQNRNYQILQPGDTIRSLVVGGDDPGASDPRIAALQQNVVTFKPHPDYVTAKKRAETLRFASGGFYFNPADKRYAEPPASSTEPTTGSLLALNGAKYRTGYGPDLIRKKQNGDPFIAARGDGQAADFDTGIGNFPDGAFAGKADEGNVAEYWQDIWGVWHYVEPYFSTWIYDPPLDTYFSPNRQVPGPAMFGSLPAPQETWEKSGWKTLLFCPNPAGANHPGARAPHDHLLLDLFNMPVVEPYAISEPFSTAGKVNLNYQLVPFGYIKRTTALRAALHPVRVTAIPQGFVTASKELRYKGQANDENLRYLVDRDETLKAFDAFFAGYALNKSSGFFKSASQICERYLYPKGQTVDGSNVKYTPGETQIRQFWENNRLTGDNVREKPYADLYPRITTKSNTYTVHYRVQSLRQRPYSGNASGADAYYKTFDESRDQILAEYRGQTTIERYLDPEDPRFRSNYTPADKRIDVEKESLEEAYRFRIISNKRFSPW